MPPVQQGGRCSRQPQQRAPGVISADCWSTYFVVALSWQFDIATNNQLFKLSKTTKVSMRPLHSTRLYYRRIIASIFTLIIVCLTRKWSVLIDPLQPLHQIFFYRCTFELPLPFLTLNTVPKPSTASRRNTRDSFNNYNCF